MKKLKSFLLVLVVLLLSSAQLFSQSYSKLTDAELIQMLEQELKTQEQLVNQQKEQLNKLQEQLNNLQIQLTLANKSYQNLKKDNLKNKIEIGLLFGFGGFFGGYVARNRMNAIQK